jgi:dinuclear metal center YbgI/SA1388 family protein
MNTRKLLLKLSKRFPKKYAKQNHDFVGLMVGKLPLEVNKIVLCLDLDQEIIDEVICLKPDLVITHHPFIYGSKTKVLKYDLEKALLVNKLEEHSICVYSMHTNFDTGKGGMNDALATKLGLEGVYAPINMEMMRLGKLNKPMDVYEFANYAKEKLDVDYGLLIANGVQTISKVALIGGGGSRYWEIAKDEGADIYISGDAPHHVRRAISTTNYNYLDLPHEIEKVFMPTLKEIINTYDENIEIIEIDHEKLPKVI